MENSKLQQLIKSKAISLGLMLSFFLILHIGTIGKENLQNDAKFKKDNGIEGNYTIDKNGLCNVDGNVDLSKRGLKEIPIPFGTVSGSFWCENNQLITLVGAPTKVGGSFDCRNNQLKTLKFAPKTVSGTFLCDNNKLTSLEGAPTKVGGSFWCNANQLTSLKGAPKTVGGDFWCSNNSIQFTVANVRKVSKVKGKIYVKE